SFPTRRSSDLHDYALFQLRIIQSHQGNNAAKIASLNSLISTFPKSNYADDVAFEIPHTYFLAGQYAQAIAGLHTMVEKYPRSSYVPRALLTIGLVQYNQGPNDAAMATLQRVLNEHATTHEARQAIRSIEHLYLQHSDPT